MVLYPFRQIRFGSLWLARCVALVFLLVSLSPGAMAMTSPVCEHAKGTPHEAVLMDAGHDPTMHAAMMDGAGSSDASATDDCLQCAVCHLACSGIALVVAQQAAFLPSGDSAAPDCAGATCASFVGEPPRRPPR